MPKDKEMSAMASLWTELVEGFSSLQAMVRIRPKPKRGGLNWHYLFWEAEGTNY